MAHFVSGIHRLAGWGGRVDLRALSRHHTQSDAAIREVPHGVDQMLEVTPEPVEFPDHQHIALAQCLEASIEAGTLVLLPGCLVLVDMFRSDTGLPQRIALKIEALGAVGFRDAGVSEEHVSYTIVFGMALRQTTGFVKNLLKLNPPKPSPS